MNCDFLEVMYDCVGTSETKEREYFADKYIMPKIEENPEEGMKMEEHFNSAMAAEGVQEFKNGFKMCMRFIFKCLET